MSKDNGYCDDCANSGWLEPGKPCHCGRATKTIYMNSDNLSIPDQYRDTVFNSNMVPTDVGTAYKYYMDKLYLDIISGKSMNINIFIGAPVKHGKTIFAYSCIAQLYRAGKQVFPLFDTGEIRRIMIDIENGKASPLLEGLDVSITALLTAPIVFVKITDDLTYETYNTVSMLLDRRTRRGGNTILLYDGSWTNFINNDRKGKVKALLGDGSFGTILNKSFWVSETKDGED